MKTVLIGMLVLSVAGLVIFRLLPTAAPNVAPAASPPPSIPETVARALPVPTRVARPPPPPRPPPAPAASEVLPRNTVLILLTVLFGAVSAWVIVAGDPDPHSRQLAFGVIGTLLGFWFVPTL